MLKFEIWYLQFKERWLSVFHHFSENQLLKRLQLKTKSSLELHTIYTAQIGNSLALFWRVRCKKIVQLGTACNIHVTKLNIYFYAQTIYLELLSSLCCGILTK